jgi:two-component system, NarL family, sensor histidine kinase DegS
MTDSPAKRVPVTVGDLSEQLAEEVVRLDLELGEVDLLITQATTEAGRHETRRATAADKLAAATRTEVAPELVELSTQVVTLTKRAALMETQVEVLEGKRRALLRHRDALSGFADLAAGMDPNAAIGKSAPVKGHRDVEPVMPPAVSRLVLTAQEDLRREIARAMHDGPAQSLTNIVLQAQIVERVVTANPAMAAGEAHQLVAMVQQTLEATKTFIFDVRPMVLDDLGLVPTLRRAARDRGRRAGIAVDMESIGQDQRLPMDLESGLFRIVDEALVGYLERSPTRVSMRLDWQPERVEVRIIAGQTPRDVAAAPAEVAPAQAGADLPPALAAMMEQRRADARGAAETARKDAIVALPETSWREILNRGQTIGIKVELLSEGAEVLVVAEIPSTQAA